MNTVYFREAVLEDEDESVDDLDRGRAKLSFSSEALCLREEDPKYGTHYELLSHKPGDCNLGLLNRQGVVLLNHSPKAMIGSVLPGSARVDADRFARAEIVLDSEWRSYLKQMKKGKSPNTWSVGYSRLSVVGREAPINGIPVIRYSFSPHEISLLTPDRPPADPSVGLDRAKPKKIMDDENENIETPAANQPNRAARRAAERAQEIELREMRRTDNIRASARIFSRDCPHLATQLNEMAERAISKGESHEEFAPRMLELIRENPRQNEIMLVDESHERSMQQFGLSRAEASQYDLFGTIRSVLEGGRPSPLAMEISRTVEKQVGVPSQGGIFIPTTAPVSLKPQSGRRDMVVNTFGAGGALVPTMVPPNIIEILRNRTVMLRLGVQPMAGLSGSVSLPRQTGAATVQSLPETSQLNVSDQALDQVPLTPHRVGSSGRYSKQLLLQSSVDLENFVRDDLLKQLSVKHDYLILQGSGAASEPLGIMNCPGIGSVAFGGAASWASVIAFETSLAKANADIGNMAYVTTPGVRAKWKQTAKIGTTYPVFLWETADFADGSDDGRVNGYRSAVTNQIANDAVCFGDFTSAYLASWGGIEVIINPYTYARQAEVEIVINSFIDVALRHPQSFCWSADAGNQ